MQTRFLYLGFITLVAMSLQAGAKNLDERPILDPQQVDKLPTIAGLCPSGWDPADIKTFTSAQSLSGFLQYCRDGHVIYRGRCMKCVPQDSEEAKKDSRRGLVACVLPWLPVNVKFNKGFNQSGNQSNFLAWCSKPGEKPIYRDQYGEVSDDFTTIKPFCKRCVQIGDPGGPIGDAPLEPNYRAGSDQGAATGTTAPPSSR